MPFSLGRPGIRAPCRLRPGFPRKQSASQIRAARPHLSAPRPRGPLPEPTQRPRPVLLASPADAHKPEAGGRGTRHLRPQQFRGRSEKPWFRGAAGGPAPPAAAAVASGGGGRPEPVLSRGAPGRTPAGAEGNGSWSWGSVTFRDVGGGAGTSSGLLSESRGWRANQRTPSARASSRRPFGRRRPGVLPRLSGAPSPRHRPAPPNSADRRPTARPTPRRQATGRAPPAAPGGAGSAEELDPDLSCE